MTTNTFRASGLKYRAGVAVTLVAVALGGFFVSSLMSADYRRHRLLSLLSGSASVDGIGLGSWLMLASPLLLLAIGVGLLWSAKQERLA